MTFEFQQGEVKVGAVKVHYWRTGGDKPALVLAHGFSDNGLCWLPTAQALAPDYDIILPDAVGHGLSSRVRYDQEIDLASDLAGLIQALRLHRPIVGGHSMGASTAASMAARYPELARALILEDPAWFDRPPAPPEPEKKPDEPNPWIEFLKKARSQPTEAVMEHARKENPLWAEIELRPWAESKQQFDVNFVAARQRNEQTNWRDTARAITVPTLLVSADPEKGALITPALSEAAADLNPRIQFVRIPGAGHNVRRENFSAFLSAVKAFLAEL